MVNGNNTIWDPLRKKEVALTPEEEVRQWFIGMLHDRMAVPMHMMMSETAFRLGAKLFRADILVYDRKCSPLAVVECKRPETEIGMEVLDQAVRYNMVLDVRYIIITNGRKTVICRKSPGHAGDADRGKDTSYEFISHVPSYTEMLGDQVSNTQEK